MLQICLHRGRDWISYEAMSHEPSSWHVYFRDLLKLFVQLFDLFAELLEWFLSLETSRHHDENAWYWLTTGIQQSKCRIRASEVSCACFKRLWSSSSLGEMWWFNPQTHRLILLEGTKWHSNAFSTLRAASSISPWTAEFNWQMHQTQLCAYVSTTFNIHKQSDRMNLTRHCNALAFSRSASSFVACSWSTNQNPFQLFAQPQGSISSRPGCILWYRLRLDLAMAKQWQNTRPWVQHLPQGCHTNSCIAHQ